MSDNSPVRPYRTIVQDSGNPGYINRLLNATPVTGLVRVEWVQARYGQIIPTNWSFVQMLQFMDSYFPLRYQVADAQNLIVKEAVEKDFEWCFRGDTVIETFEGGKKIKDIQVGELVRTHTGAFRKVIRVMKRDLKQRHPTIWIKTPYSTIKCTEGHPFLTGIEGEWTKAIDLKPGRFLLYPQSTKNDYLEINVQCNTNGHNGDGKAGSIKNGRTIGTLPVTRDLARFMGLYLAEGHGERDGVIFTFNNSERDYIDFVADICINIFGRKPTIRSTWATQVRLNIRNLSPWFTNQFGSNAREKRVPEFVFEWNTLNKLEFLRGYLDGDGSYNSSGCAFSSASHQLIEDINRLVCSMGLEPAPQYEIESSVSFIGGHKVTNVGSLMSRLPKKSLEKMFDLLDAVTYEDYLLIPVQKIEKHPLAANLIDNAVYNLEVEYDNSYIADCAAVHNCLLLEHDVILPPDALMRFNQYMREEQVPVVSGLYYTRSIPSEPLIYRGRGNSFYTDWQMGDKVWCDGVPTGCLLIHCGILRAMWQDAEPYQLAGIQVRRVFETPTRSWHDPETGTFNMTSGTSDLDWCTKVMTGGYFGKAGWTEYEGREFPFLCDTNIFCKHINPDGQQFPP